MEGSRPPAPPGLPPPVGHPVWRVGLLALLAGQACLTLGLFGDAARLRDDDPILTGQHPLHQYHGHLGARALVADGSLSAYDPAYHAGYPKTPVFDGGSRPADFLFVLAGGAFRPSVYKVGLAVFCTLVPLAFWWAARGLRLPRGPALLAAVLGVVVFWQPPCQALVREGNLDLLLAGLLVLAQAGGLIGFHERPGLAAWVGIVLAGFFAWFAHPVVMAVLLPPALLYYFQVGPAHRPVWHAALVIGLLSAIAANAFWLCDWVGYWWLRLPLRFDGPRGEGVFAALWNAPVWGDATSRAVALALLGLSVAGLVVLGRRGQGAAAALFGVYLGELLVIAGLGVLATLFIALDTSRVLVLAVFFAVPLGVVALHAAWRGCLVLAVPLLWLLPVALPGGLREPVAPLQVGFTPEQAAIVAALRERTTPTARILWEDRPAEPGWTALLALTTGRPFIGGLDPEPRIEHLTNGLSDGRLCGRPIAESGDSDLADYCDRYNVGWVVAWTPAARRRLEAWPAIRPLTTLALGGVEGRLYAVERRHGYALVGHAELLHADDERIVLGDVRPWQGRVVVSLHHVAGLRATPARVKVEAEIDPRDAIPRVRLRIDEPVARVTLTWSRR